MATQDIKYSTDLVSDTLISFMQKAGLITKQQQPVMILFNKDKTATIVSVEEILEKDEALEKLLDTSIEDFRDEMSVKLYNLLHRHVYYTKKKDFTWRELLKFDQKTVRKWDQVGPRTFGELIEFLKSKGLDMAEDNSADS